MKLMLMEPVTQGGRSNRTARLHLVFEYPAGVEHCIPALSSRRDSEAFRKVVAQTVAARANGHEPTRPFWTVLSWLSINRLRQLVATGLVSQAEARPGDRLVDHLDAYVYAAVKAGCDKAAMRDARKRLLAMFGRLGWYVAEDISPTAMMNWYRGLSKYGPRWDREANPKAEGKSKLVAFIPFARWLEAERGGSKASASTAEWLLDETPEPLR